MKFKEFIAWQGIGAVAVVLYVWAPIAGAAAYSGGLGTETTPYMIGTVADWNTLALAGGDWDKCFILIADIDFGGAPLTPVGNDTHSFNGVFDGRGHVLSNGNIWISNQYVGLFANVGTGEIRDLGVEGMDITGPLTVGGLAGRNAGSITSCYVTGTVLGGEDSIFVGGLVGHNLGSILSCYTTGNVTGNDKVGGLVGINEEGSVTSCYASGEVTGNSHVGGLVGYLYASYKSSHVPGSNSEVDDIRETNGSASDKWDSNVEKSYATGTVTGGTSVGGLAGTNDRGDILSCYATGPVTADSSVGGLLGYNDGTVSSCYARGAVTGDEAGWNIGGLVGSNDGQVSFCFSTGEVSGGGEDPYVGGLVGRNWLGTASACYWDTITSGTSTSAAGEGRSTTEMSYPYAENTYVGWDFEAIWAADVATRLNDGYPYLLNNAPGRYSGGAGTQGDPYIIGKKADWITLSSTTLDWSDCFVLAVDIDLSGSLLLPVGDRFIQFQGVVDGGGHVLRNAHIHLPEEDYTGLFGHLGAGSVIRNLGVVAVDVSGNQYVGGLAGANDGIIESCFTTGAVAGDEYVGGLVGKNYGTVNRCNTTGEVLGNWYIGGLAGYNEQGEITSCYSTGNVTGETTSQFIGGLVGLNKGTVLSCYTTGAVSGNSEAGGVAGFNYEGDIVSCCATGEITVAYFGGGLVGINSSGTVANCYARGAVRGGENVGGLMGKNTGTVEACYATGVVTGTEPIGGLIGINESDVVVCYWDVDTSGVSTSAGGEGRLTEEMTYPYAEGTYMHWDFADAWAEDVDGALNNGYPYFPGNVPPPPYSGGAGTVADPYQIGSRADWIKLSATTGDWDKYFILIEDIDLGGDPVMPVGNETWNFTGIFDGNNYELGNAHITLPEKEHVGLFGYVGPGGMIRDLGVREVTVTGGQYVGGLAGYSKGIITSCYTIESSVEIAGAVYIGGLVGHNDGGMLTSCRFAGAVTDSATGIFVGGLVGCNTGGSIVSCSAVGEVTGQQYVGGLVGYTIDGRIMLCYARGVVTGHMGGIYVGGLAGADFEGVIQGCYASAVVTGEEDVGGLLGYSNGTVTSSYWDMDISGLAVSAGGEGRLIDDMTYSYAAETYVGWDFTNIWAADTEYSMNDGYPYLRNTISSPPHPADLNADFRIVLGEAIAYLAGWQDGGNPIAYAIRAAYLWQNGENYLFDWDNAPPMCWLLAP